MQQSLEHPLAKRIRELGQGWHRRALQNERRLVGLAIVSFILIFTGLGAWKLWSFGYNALDLAIYRQVAEHSVHGQLFSFTIHPHSYLGDHLELFFTALWPLYGVVPSALTLVFLQAAALAVTALPLAKIAARFVGKPWHLLLVAAYLGNPAIQNMALFEFHLLPFAIPLVSYTLLAYCERRFFRFLVFSVLALTVREDVSLVIVGFGVLALVERRSWRWSIVPIMLGGAWFAAALKLTAYFSGYAEYKFLAYYRWLGNSLPEMLRTALTKPWLVLQRFVAPGNLAFFFAVLLPFAYLPLARVRWLIPAAPIFLQLMLVQSPGELLLSIHYPALLIPFLVVATAAVLQQVFRPPPTAVGHRILRDPAEGGDGAPPKAAASGLFAKLARQRAMTLIIFVVVIVYSMLVIGPLAQAVPVLAGTLKINDRVAVERSFTKQLPTDVPTVAGFETITELSKRRRLYSLHYVFLGNKQFSTERYVLPNDANQILLDQRDFLLYHLLYRYDEGDNRNGYRRLRELISSRGFAITNYVDRFAVLQRTGTSDASALYSIGDPGQLHGTASSHGLLTFNGWAGPDQRLQSVSATVDGRTFMTLPFSLSFTKHEEKSDILHVEFRFIKGDQVVYRALMPLGGGLYPTSDWPVGETVTTNYRLLLPSFLPPGELSMAARVIKADGDVGLNGLRSLQLRYKTYEQLGPTIELGPIER
ncbi:MAG: DUF2079 domain-containing protein [Candidatus Kerfeldbacteria bacterium]|nr:DUF2079 domain-containing protein [Candidatus Kerfeldbacteria bacterium]